MYTETPRMLIRDFTRSDAANLHEILGDAETMEYCEPAYDLSGSWDGSDICRNESIPGHIIFSKAAADLVKKYKLKGFSFEPLER